MAADSQYTDSESVFKMVCPTPAETALELSHKSVAMINAGMFELAEQYHAMMIEAEFRK